MYKACGGLHCVTIAVMYVCRFCLYHYVDTYKKILLFLYFLSAGHISVEYEVFIHHFSQIVSSISARALSPYFVQQNIISPSDHLEIINATSSNKASGLLLSTISSALKANFTKIFYKFLDITEQYGSLDSANVIGTIRKKLLQLKSNDKGIS